MILLTGATGANGGRTSILRPAGTGTELARLLSTRKIPFRAYVRNVRRAEELNIPYMEIFEGDMKNTKALEKAMLGISRVYLLSSPDPMQVELQGNVVRAAKKANVSLIVKQSAFTAAQDSPAALARWHWQTEKEIKESLIPYTILRPIMFMQNFLMFADDISVGGVLKAPVGDSKVSLLDARDVALCAAEILTGEGHAGRTYHLTGPNPIGYAEVAEILSEVLGRHITYVNIPLDDAKNDMILKGFPPWLADDICKIYEMFPTGRMERVTTAVPAITGKKASDFRKFCQDYSGFFIRQVVPRPNTPPTFLS